VQRRAPGASGRCAAAFTRVDAGSRRAASSAVPRPPHRSTSAEGRMIDLVYVLATVGFFALAWAYARACDRI
jgi:hypothetical protein